ncbi:hypothetical protein FRX31_026142, partial [Thalictrum thalictroides]
MSQNGESSKRNAKYRKRKNLAILAALKKNNNAGVKILAKKSGSKHFSHDAISGDIVRKSHSNRSEYTRSKIKKTKNDKVTNKKGKDKKNMKGTKKSLPSEDSCDEVYSDNSDEDYRNDDNNDGESTENSCDDNDGSSSEMDASEEEESIPANTKV